MKANEIYQAKADEIYAKLGHALMQKKQADELVEELEFQLKALVVSYPLLQKVESDGQE